MKYYIVVNKEQKGPYEYEELSQIGLNINTPVWREGLPQWVKASQLPELNGILNNNSCLPPQIPIEMINDSVNPNVKTAGTSKKASKWWAILPILSIICSLVCVGLCIYALERDFYYYISFSEEWHKSTSPEDYINCGFGYVGGALLLAIGAVIFNKIKSLNIISWILMGLSLTFAAISAIIYYTA